MMTATAEQEKGLTKAEKKAAIDAAWARYRAATQAIPNLPWRDYLGRDDALFQMYLTTERGILREAERAE